MCVCVVVDVISVCDRGAEEEPVRVFFVVVKSYLCRVSTFSTVVCPQR